MYKKNEVKLGGSFYIQSKIHNAKEFLIKDFPGAEEQYRKENKLDEQEKEEKEKEQKEREEAEKQKDQANLKAQAKKEQSEQQ